MSTTPEVAQIKAVMKAVWTAGDFGQIAALSVKTAEEFVARSHGSSIIRIRRTWRPPSNGVSSQILTISRAVRGNTSSTEFNCGT